MFDNKVLVEVLEIHLLKAHKLNTPIYYCNYIHST